MRNYDFSVRSGTSGTVGTLCDTFYYFIEINSNNNLIGVNGLNNIKVIEESTDKLIEYSKISIAFEVKSEYKINIIENGLGGFLLEEETVSSYWRDFDSVEHNPGTLPQRFCLDNWQVISAYHNNQRIGGAIIAYKTEGINMLEGKDDIAVLWDIRIDKEYRGKGVGTQIIQSCLKWARKMKCTRLKIETQNNNVRACKFYAKQGAQLSNMNRFTYKEYPEEVQLIFNIYLSNCK